jgi:hypothetical protein
MWHSATGFAIYQIEISPVYLTEQLTSKHKVLKVQIKNSSPAKTLKNFQNQLTTQQ